MYVCTDIRRKGVIEIQSNVTAHRSLFVYHRNDTIAAGKNIPRQYTAKTVIIAAQKYS